MILGAGLLLLLGLVLLVAGVLTGVTALYWGCVVVCLVAAVLLVLVRRQMASEAAPAERPMTERPMAGRERADRPPTAPPERRHEPETAVPPTEPEPRASEVRTPEVRAPEVRTAEVRTPDWRRKPATDASGEPPLEEVEVTDLLLVMDLRDEVLVVDEHPRYHLSGCAHLTGRETFPMPIDEARSDGFTPCGTCAPDRHLAQLARERKAGRR